MVLSVVKMRSYAKRVWDIAFSHGWHDTRLSDMGYIGLAMTEVSEAINADRKNRSYPQLPDISTMNDADFQAFYDTNVKDTVETEIADVVIRLVDYAYLKWGDNMDWLHGYESRPDSAKSFLDVGTYLMKYVLFPERPYVVNGITYCYEWANLLGFDLDKHIECKIRYNDLRPYRHGNKKY